MSSTSAPKMDLEHKLESKFPNVTQKVKSVLTGCANDTDRCLAATQHELDVDAHAHTNVEHWALSSACSRGPDIDKPTK